MTAEAQALVPSPAREQAMIERGLAMDNTSFEHGISVFSNGTAFQLGVRMAEQLAHSNFLPDAYRGNQGDCLVLIEYASRLRVPVIQLAQNMDVVKGRPGLRGTFLAGIINASPLFSRLKYEWRGNAGKDGKPPSNDYGCRAYATEAETSDVLYGTWIDWAMVTGEKWSSNQKWNTMREQMFMYRAASFWSRAHASDVTLGLYESEELHDANPAPRSRAITHEGTTVVDDFAARMEKRSAGLARASADAEDAENVVEMAAAVEVASDPDANTTPDPPGDDDKGAPEADYAPAAPRRRRGTIE